VARNSSALPARLEIANSLEELVSLVKDEAKDLVSQRIAQFKNFPRHDVSNLFSELSFVCLLRTGALKVECVLRSSLVRVF